MSEARDNYNNILRTYNENPDVLICDAYIAELEQQLNQSKWISVKDKLPETPCIFFWDDKRITIVEDKTDSININYCINGNPDFRVTHWMSLPELPK